MKNISTDEQFVDEILGSIEFSVHKTSQQVMNRVTDFIIQKQKSDGISNEQMIKLLTEKVPTLLSTHIQKELGVMLGLIDSSPKNP